MKRVISIMALAAFLSFGNTAYAQDDAAVDETSTEMADDTAAAEAVDTNAVVEEEPVQEEAAPPAPAEEAEEAPQEFTQVIKQKFIEGGPGFMSIVLLALVLGLAICIERIIYLALSNSNAKSLLNEIDSALNSGGIEAAKDVCRDQRGPIASVFYEGLDHFDEGLEMVDKAIIATGSVEQGRLEKGTSWISLFIALAPMLGFMGTVIGMIGAFDAIEAAGDISPSLVAGGIKVALLTTVFGLIVAMILQVFYNLIISMIDSIVIKLEDASISFMDLLVDFDKKNK
jgi:biopolymer transport protein ExbB